MVSIAQNFAPESEVALNKQINVELYASYVYMSMGAYFDRTDIALPGFAKFFYKSSTEEREHAMKFIRYMNLRGGKVVFQNIQKPESDDWGNGLDAMTTALTLEKNVNEGLLELHAIAGRHGDAQLCDFLETHFLTHQVESIRQLGCYVANLNRVGSGLGEYTFDQETLKGE